MHNHNSLRLESEGRCVSGGGATRAVCVGGGMAQKITARWNAVLDALAEYDDPHKSITSTTATRMADILSSALDA